MGERSFAEPVKATEIVDSVQKLKPQREYNDLRLMWYGAILGGVTVLLFEIALLVIGVL
jgi:hypothetical protein